MTHYIQDFYPLKAQFRTHEKIELALELLNPTGEGVELHLESKVTRLADEIERIPCEVSLLPGEGKTLTITVAPKNVEFEGYGMEVCAYIHGELKQEFSTAFDVVSDWRKATRYGFLSDFYPQEKGDEEDVKTMCKFHLNLVQFYDWMYKHDHLVPPVSDFTDLMGRKLNFDVVKEKVSFCHKYGMKAIAYGAVYAASSDFFNEHKEWAFYNSSGEVFDFISIFKIMNIAPESPWHRHIIGEYKKALLEAGFDGIHMDTYGYPKVAVSKLQGNEKVERLEQLFPLLINNTRKELEEVHKDVCLIFNNVGNWPVDTVAEAHQDAIYIEVWKPYERYHHIQQILQWAKYLGKGKQVILAAYLKPFMEKEPEKRREANVSALLLTALIAANGGHHLLLGEKNGVLTQGYYVDHSTMEEDFARGMRNYYDFMVRYSKILYNSSLRDVSMTHTEGDNLEYVFENVEYSTYGEPGKVWVIIRENSGCKSINFINLTGNSEDFWNQGKKMPVIQNAIRVKVQIHTEPKAVYAASPDNRMGRAEKLNYGIENSDRGKILIVKVPPLSLWSLLVMEF